MRIEKCFLKFQELFKLHNFFNLKKKKSKKLHLDARFFQQVQTLESAVAFPWFDNSDKICEFFQLFDCLIMNIWGRM